VPFTSLPPLDPRVRELLGELPPGLFDDQFYRSWELVDRYGSELALRLPADLGLEALLARPASAGELVATCGFAPRFGRVLEWLLQHLAALGAVEEVAGEPLRYRLLAGGGQEDLTWLRTACLEADPRNAPALDLLDTARTAYPAIAHGKLSGEEALFGPGQTRLWLAYFNNDNPTYAINNRLAAIAAARRWPLAEPAVVLELGGGSGSATQALLEELSARGLDGQLARYRFTEPAPHFRRRAERTLRASHPDLPWELDALDLNRPFTGQAIEAGSCHLVLAVNVLHLARDLDATLGEIRESLVPGGWLVAAEAMRSYPRRPLSTELVFQLLESFQQVELDARRPRPGFLTAEQWQVFLEDARFSAAEVIPDHRQIRELYPRFATGVVCGRR
jgi:SAM-dependent methyltransferase